MNRRTNRGAWATITALGCLVTPTVPGSAAAAASASPGAGGRMQLIPHADLLGGIDTRDSGGPTTHVVLPSSVWINIIVTDVTAPGQVFVHPCAVAPTAASTAVFQVRPGETMANTAITGPDAACLSATTPVNVLTSTRANVYPTPIGGSQYVALPEPVDVSVPFAVDGVAQIDLPAVPSDAVGTVLGVTAAAVDSPGSLVVHPCGRPLPLVSDLPTGPTPTGSVVVTPLAAPGAATQCLFTRGRTVAQVTVLGYLRTAGPDQLSLPPTLHWNFRSVTPPGLDALTPTRVLDTREPIGVPLAAKLDAGGVQVLDVASYVTFQTTAVVLNVTVTDPDAPGYVTVFPCDEERPTASNLNYVKGQTVANLVTVSLAADATVCLYSQARTHLVADLTGTYEFGAGDGTVALPPARILDTRTPIGVPAAGRLGGGQVLRLAVAGHGGVPANGAKAVTMNVTVTDPTGDGYVTVYPCDAVKRPTASNLNYVAGQTVPNAVTVKLSATGEVCLYSQSAAHLVADVNAWFGPAAASGFEELVPFRALDTRLWPSAPPVRGALSAGGVLMGGQPSGIALRDNPGLVGYNVLPADARAAVLNVTVTNPRGSGYLTVYPCDAPRPTVSNLNFAAGQTVPNQVTVALGAAPGTSTDLCFYSQQIVDVVVDVAGYYTDRPEAGWVPDVA